VIACGGVSAARRRKAHRRKTLRADYGGDASTGWPASQTYERGSASSSRERAARMTENMARQKLHRTPKAKGNASTADDAPTADRSSSLADRQPPQGRGYDGNGAEQLDQTIGGNCCEGRPTIRYQPTDSKPRAKSHGAAHQAVKKGNRGAGPTPGPVLADSRGTQTSWGDPRGERGRVTKPGRKPPGGGRDPRGRPPKNHVERFRGPK